MANTKSAVGSAVPSALNTNWLTVDTSAAQRGSGPAKYGYPGTEPAPVVPVADNPLPTDEPDYTTPSGTYQVDSEGWGAWPSVPENLPWGTRYPLQRPQGPPQGLTETLEPSGGAYGYKGAWARVEPLQTYDYLSQHKDQYGWIQNVPNDRTSHRNTWGQANPENNPTWAPYGERPVRTRPARLAAPFTPDQIGRAHV